MLTVVPDGSVSLPADGLSASSSSLIDQLVREGARQMLAAALRAEVAAYVDQFADVRDEDGRRMVVRNGSAEPRTVLTSAGAVKVTAPRVNDKRTDPESGQRISGGAAEVRASGREEGAGGDLERRGQGPRPRCGEGVRRRLRAKFPKAAAKVTSDEEELLAFYDYPAGHWVHLRTTNPIEPAFATFRLRTKAAKGHGSKAAGLAMAFKLIESAQRRWRMVNAPHLVPLVRAGATFADGKLAERPGEDAPPQAA